ncbi:hypothetical protein Ga0080574_TMP5000 (plasmid) [Salipiger abyssi]|uniref:Uncharacterized protein n=1 Tax=Salipiger abyssi TaxID=1250539 RepID=A0A1P8V0V4_9RHOB|nr:hypothetical protein Ga0080574_TMP5000 [Salipiger abyssi]
MRHRNLDLRTSARAARMVLGPSPAVPVVPVGAGPFRIMC